MEEWGGTLTTRIPRSTSKGKSVVMQPNVRAWIFSRFVQYVAFQRIMGVILGLKAWTGLRDVENAYQDYGINEWKFGLGKQDWRTLLLTLIGVYVTIIMELSSKMKMVLTMTYRLHVQSKSITSMGKNCSAKQCQWRSTRENIQELTETSICFCSVCMVVQ